MLPILTTLSPNHNVNKFLTSTTQIHLNHLEVQLTWREVKLNFLTPNQISTYKCQGSAEVHMTVEILPQILEFIHPDPDLSDIVKL